MTKCRSPGGLGVGQGGGVLEGGGLVHLSHKTVSINHFSFFLFHEKGEPKQKVRPTSVRLTAVPNRLIVVPLRYIFFLSQCLYLALDL